MGSYSSNIWNFVLLFGTLILIPHSQTRFCQLTKSTSKFWTPDCNVCVFHFASLSVDSLGKRRESFFSCENRQIKSRTQECVGAEKKVRSELCLVRKSYFHQIQHYWKEKDGEEKVGNELCLVQPLLLKLPLIEKYISTQSRNVFLYNWEMYFCTVQKYVYIQMRYIFLEIEKYTKCNCFFSRCR